MANTQPETFPGLVDAIAARFGGRTFLPRRHGQGGGSVTYSELRDDVRNVARALLARGVRRGDRVGLIAENSYTWILADLAITYIGAVDVPRGVDTTPQELRQILTHSGCRFAFGETPTAVGELVTLAGEIAGLEQIFSLEEDSADDTVATVFDLVRFGASDEARDIDLDSARDAVQPDDLLTIVYTSGTTADPKGVMLTHFNMVHNAFSVNTVLGAGPDDVFLSALPAWHVYERIMDYLAFSVGGQLVYTTRRKIKEDLRGVQPTIFAAVPRIWESIHDGIINAVDKMPGVKGKLMHAVLANCREVGAGRAGPFARILHRIYAVTLLKKILAATGGRVRIAVSGGGALPTHVDEMLLGIGLPLLNGYGLTETSPVVCVRPPGHNVVGTIGPVLAQTQIEIRSPEGRPLPPGEVGVVWIKGPQVMRGYYENPETTARVLQDGWFNSGDLGKVDDNGHFAITGRAKDTIVLAGGENVEPEPVETGIKSSNLIDQAVVLGQDEKVLGAILIPTPECLEKQVPRTEWGEKDGELTGERVVRLFRNELDRTLTREAGFRPIERVARFKIRLEPMTVENGLLTPTMKVKRHEVRTSMADMICELFD
jgi:long-chain acyl-CoA synthetase